MKKTYLEDFIKTFKPLLEFYTPPKKDQYKRWAAFEFIAQELFKKNKELLIVETGTLKKDTDWLGYGHSALLWDWIVERTGGKIYSVDINMEAVKFTRARCKHVRPIHCDSIGFLRGFNEENIDLLYLDSYDYSAETHIPSCLHHLGELAAIWDRIPSGCLVAVDDRHDDARGKHVLVELFFSKIIKIEPLIKCHVVVWRKP